MPPTTNAAAKAVSRPLLPRQSAEKPPSMGSDASMTRPTVAHTMVDRKLIWLLRGMSRLRLSVKCLAVVAATTTERMPMEYRYGLVMISSM